MRHKWERHNGKARRCINYGMRRGIIQQSFKAGASHGWDKAQESKWININHRVPEYMQACIVHVTIGSVSV